MDDEGTGNPLFANGSVKVERPVSVLSRSSCALCDLSSLLENMTRPGNLKVFSLVRLVPETKLGVHGNNFVQRIEHENILGDYYISVFISTY